MSAARRMAALIALLAALSAGVAGAVQPDEILDDPALEERARALSRELRCLVCRNQSIDDSDADLARDLRLLVRERLVAGDSDEEAMAFIVERYGEYVLLRPTFTGANLLLWTAGPAMLMLGFGGALIYLRRRAAGRGPAPLSEEERRELERMLEG